MSNEVQKVDQLPAAPVSNMLEIISRAASDPNVDIEKLERLMALKERMDAKQAEIDFNAAMSRIQAETRRIAADGSNRQTNSKYATYAALDRVLRPIYTREGLSLSFGTETAPEGMVGMVCYVSHEHGHTREYRAQVPSDGKGAKGGDVMTKTHAFGSGTSYGMRYLLKMIFNVAIGEDDDDGNGSVESVDQSWLDAVEAAADVTGLRSLKEEMIKVWKDAAKIPKSLITAYNVKFNELRAVK